MTSQQQKEIEAKVLINFMVLNAKIKCLKSVLTPEQLLVYQSAMGIEKQKFQSDLMAEFLTQEQVHAILLGLDK